MQLHNQSMSFRVLFIGLVAFSFLDTSIVLAEEHKKIAGFRLLEEIIVTARKREESMQDIPVAMTVMNEELLREKMVNDPYDLGKQISGLNMRAGSGSRNSPDYFMRGQGPTNNAPAAVVSYFADAPGGGGALAGTNIQFYDNESIQILKGPQGTLFGRSSTGGAVLITPKSPANEFEGFIETTAGNYDFLEVTGGVSIPLIEDKLSIRLSGTSVDREGFTKSLGTGEDLDDRGRTSWRASVRFTPTDWLSSDFLFQDDKENENGTSTVLLRLAPGFPFWDPNVGPFIVQGICAGVTAGNPAGFPACVAERTALLASLVNGMNAEVERVRSGGEDAVRKSQSAGDSIASSHQQLFVNNTKIELGEISFLGEVTLKNIFSARRVLYSTSVRPLAGAPGFHAIPTNGFDVSLDVDFSDRKNDGARTDWDGHITEEFQIQGLVDQKHTWILGYFLERVKRDINPMTFFPIFNNITTPELEPTPLFNFTADSYSRQRGVFGQFTIDLSELLTEGLHFTAGYRKSFNENSNINLAPVRTATGGWAPGDVQVGSSSFSETAPSWTVSLDYQIDEDTLVYIAHRRGFKPGGVNGIAAGSGVQGAVAVYNPEKLDDIELGLKMDWQLADIQGRTNVAIYQQWYQDIQRNETLVVNNQTLTQINNISEATIQGLELDTQLGLTENLSVNLTYTYIDAQYDKWPGTLVDALGRTVFYKDSPYPGTPEHAGSIALNYRLPFVDEALGEVSLSASYYIQSTVVLHDEAINDPFDESVQGGWGELNLRADWANIAGSALDGAVFVNNATDDVHLIGSSNFYGLGYAGGIYNEPRMWGVELRYRFGASANQ